jgi:hypothetical protein
MQNSSMAKMVRALIVAAHDRLETYAEPNVQEVLMRLGAQEMDDDHVVQPEPQSLPVLTYLDQCLEETEHFDAEIADAISALRPHLKWLQSKAYNDALLGTGFIENYGWTEIIGPNGFFHGDDFLFGLLMLGPNQHYRDHFHPAPELYWPLTSDTEWRKGDEALTPKAAGTVIWHQPNIIHATRTRAKPLLTLWSWTKDTAIPAKLI